MGYTSITDTERKNLFDALDALPEPYGYTLKANKDGSISLTLGGKRGHTKGRPTMRVRGSAGAVIHNAREYLRLLELRGDKVCAPEANDHE
jgi:hypothetical protein